MKKIISIAFVGSLLLCGHLFANFDDSFRSIVREVNDEFPGLFHDEQFKSGGDMLWIERCYASLQAIADCRTMRCLAILNLLEEALDMYLKKIYTPLCVFAHKVTVFRAEDVSFREAYYDYPEKGPIAERLLTEFTTLRENVFLSLHTNVMS